MYESRRSPKEIIITDRSRIALETGYKGRHVEYGGLKSAPKLTIDELPIVPRREWEGRIEQLDRKGDLLSMRAVKLGWKIKDQRHTNYCWVFAATAAVEITCLLQNNKYQSLSPASVGAKITRFRNVGGWSTKAIEYISDNGIVPSQFWPDTAISRTYDDERIWRDEASKYRVIEWRDLEPGNLDVLYSALLAGFPVAVGYNWWGHAVVALDPVIVNGQYGIRIANSWGPNWSDGGFGILVGRRAIPDDAVIAWTLMPA